MAAIQDFMALVFSSRDYAHKAHLGTESYAEHMALGAFYDDVIEEADALAELWMGRNGEKLEGIPTYDAKTKGKPADVLKQYCSNLESLRAELGKDDSVIQNQVDTLIGVYATAIYKLTFLK